MSQHLINDFMNRVYIFKPLQGEKISNKKISKYQASNRNNNNSPQDFEDSEHMLKPISGAQPREKKVPEGIVDIVI